MPRKYTILILSGAGVLVAAGVMVAMATVMLMTFDWNRVKPWLNARITEATGRPFAIQGNLAMEWQRSPVQESGWKGLMPWPRLRAEKITLGNPDWVQARPDTTANMAEIRQATFSIDPLALLGHEISIPLLELDHPSLVLQRSADGRNNWTLTADALSDWTLRIRRLRLQDGSVRVIDAMRRADIKASVNLPGNGDDETNRVDWKLSGTFNGAAVSGGLRTGGIPSFQQETRPFPIAGEVRMGKTAIGMNGSLVRQADSASLDLRVKLSGASMAQLYPIFGVPLPESAPFSVDGRLQGKLREDASSWKYEHFKGMMGGSDLAGTLEYRTGKPRPYLTGEVVSKALRMEDLAALTGADRKAGGAQSHAARSATDRILPTQALRTDRWRKIDADVRLVGHKILRGKQLPIDNLEAGMHLKDGILSLELLNIGEIDGNLAAVLTLDGRMRTIKTQARISARRVNLKQLFPALQSMKTSPGEINGEVSISAVGNSLAALLGSANGEITLLMNNASMSRLLLQDIGLNINSDVLARLFGDGLLKLHCLAGDLKLTDGLMVPRAFVVDSDESIVFVDGWINLVNEQLEIIADPRSHGLSLHSLRTPVYVNGTFGNPMLDLAQTAEGNPSEAFPIGISGSIATALPKPTRGSRAQDRGCNQLLKHLKTQQATSAVNSVLVR